MSRQAIDLLTFHNVHPAVDSSLMDLSSYELNTTDDLDRLRDEAFAEADRLGRPGRLYAAWVEALRRGADEVLPDLNAANGAMPRTPEQLQADIEYNKGSTAKYPNRSLMDPQLAAITLDGQSLADLPVEYSMARLHAMLVDTQPGPQRDAVSSLISKLDATPASSMNNIEWDIPEQRLEVQVASSSGAEADPYSVWRNGPSGDHGLEGLAIRPSVGTDAIWSGITDWSGSGGTYEVASDWAMAAAASSGGNFDDEE